MENYLGIKINNDLDKEFIDHAISLRRKYYLLENKTPQKAFARASVVYSKEDIEFVQRIYDYTSTRKFMFSSPILSNAPLPEKNYGLNQFLVSLAMYRIRLNLLSIILLPYAGIL